MEDESPYQKKPGISIEPNMGPIRKITIGYDINSRIAEQLNGKVSVGKQTFSVSSIHYDNEFLQKFGKVRILIMVKDGKDDHIEYVWKEIVDAHVMEFDLNTKATQE